MKHGKGRSKKSFDRFLKMYKYKDTAFKMTNYPLLGQLGRNVLDASNTNLTYIPVCENLELPSGVTAPISIIEHFIREASHHVLLSRCPCRSENGCRDYDPYLGCIFLGEAAKDVDPAVGKHVSVDEALEQLRVATDAGLISCLGKFKGDAIMLGVKDHHRLMTICHCCPCCCISTSLHYASKDARDALVKMEGLNLEVLEDRCTGCGKCVKACIFKQITVEDGKAVIGDECKGCGRCAAACKEEAIRISIDDPGYFDACVARIGTRVNIN
jgi:ferredoxin